MNKSARMLFLTQAVLASSIFATPFIAKATTFGPGIFFGPIATSAQPDNTVEVLGGTASGQIIGLGVNDGVDLDSGGGIVITRTQNQIDPINTITTSSGVGVKITGGGGLLSIEFNSGVSSTGAAGEAITISGAGAEIINAGNITVLGVGLDAIEVKLGGINATVNNLLTGVISNTAAAALPLIRVDSGASGFTLNNEGTITSNNPALDTIQLLSPFNVINNTVNGVISHNGADAFGEGSVITTASGATSGDIFNAGLMILPDPAAIGNVVFITPLTPTSGNIINTGSMISQHGSTIVISASMTSTLPNINNSGTLYGANLDVGNAVIFNRTPGDVLSGGILNTGNILLDPISASPNAIDLQTNFAFATFTQNDGAVAGNVLLAPFDSNGFGNTFIMNGGTIEGNVFAGTLIPNTLTLAGGEITDTVFLGPFGDTVDLSGTILVRLIGGIGADTVNITGGDITDLMDLGLGFNVVNVGGPFPGEPGTVFTQSGIFQATKGALFINVNGLGTVYTINNDIFDVGGFINNQGSTTVLNELIVFTSGGGDFNNFGTTIVPSGKDPVIDFSQDLNGIFLNTGTLRLDPNSSLTLDAVATGTVALFTNSKGGFFDPQIQGLIGPGGGTLGSTLFLNDISVGSAILEAGSFVAPSVSGFIPDGETFTIITVNPQIGGGTIIDNSTLIQPPSAVVFFTKELDADANDLLLTAHRKTFSSFVECGGIEGVAALLDIFAFNTALITDQNLLNILIQLDTILTAEGVVEAFESFTPDVSFAKYFSATLGMNSVFQGIFERIPAFGKAFSYNNLRVGTPRNPKRRKVRQSQFDAFTSTIKVADNGGVSFGDRQGAWAGWGRLYDARLNGRQHCGSQGFKADGFGGVIGVDYVVNDRSTLGIAGSYTKVNADGKEADPKGVYTKSWQVTLYGLFEFQDGIFMDAMMGWALNKFDSKRNIALNEINTTAKADFDGQLFGAQFDLGWRAMYCSDYYFAPFARLKYAHLHVDGFTERGADFLNLSVDSDSIKEWLGGLGFKFGTAICCKDVVWIPELTLMAGFDFNRDQEEVAAAFIDISGTPVFDTVGGSLGRGIFDLGLALHAHAGKNRMFTARYDLETRNRFTSNTLHLQFLVCY